MEREFGKELEDVINQRAEVRARELLAVYLDKFKEQIFGAEGGTSPVVEELLAQPAADPS